MSRVEGKTRSKAPSVRWTSPPNTTIVLSDLGENMVGRVFMETKVFIARVQVPPQIRRVRRRIWGGLGRGQMPRPPSETPPPFPRRHP